MQARHAHGESEAGTELLDLPEPADLEVTGGTQAGSTATTGTDVFETADGAALLSDPFADDLDDKLKARRKLRFNAKSTMVLTALVLVTAGFLAGAQVQKHYGVTTSASGTGMPGAGNFPGMGASGFARGNQNGFGQNGSGQSGAAQRDGQSGAQGGGTGSATTGTVKMVDGNTVYVQTADGRTVIVHTSPSTSVQIGQKGTLGDIAAGAQITVEGQAGTDGAVTASKVTRN